MSKASLSSLLGSPSSRARPMPVPRAMINTRISSLESILSNRAFSTLRILPLRGRMAWKRRSRPCLAEPPAESPSTMNSSLWAGSFSEQSASLPGNEPLSRALLRRINSLALRAASRPRGVDGLADDPAGDRRVLLEVRPEGLVDGRLDDPLHLAVPQFGLGLALELWVPQLHADDGGEPLADVISGQRLCVLLQQVVRVRVVVDCASKRRFEADQVGAALARVDVVG